MPIFLSLLCHHLLLFPFAHPLSHRQPKWTGLPCMYSPSYFWATVTYIWNVWSNDDHRDRMFPPSACTYQLSDPNPILFLLICSGILVGIARRLPGQVSIIATICGFLLLPLSCILVIFVTVILSVQIQSYQVAITPIAIVGISHPPISADITIAQ